MSAAINVVYGVTCLESIRSSSSCRLTILMFGLSDRQSNPVYQDRKKSFPLKVIDCILHVLPNSGEKLGRLG
jgi:hypothetical protein